MLVAAGAFEFFEGSIGWLPSSAVALDIRSLVEVLFTAAVVWLLIKLGAPYGMVVFACVVAFTTAITLLVLSGAIGTEFGGFDPFSGSMERVIANLSRAGGVVVGAFLARYVSGLHRTREEQRQGVVLAGWYLLAVIPAALVGTGMAVFTFIARPGVTYGWYWWGPAQPWLRGGVVGIVVFLSVLLLGAPRSMWLPVFGTWLALLGGSLFGLIGAHDLLAAARSIVAGSVPSMIPWGFAMLAVVLATWARPRPVASAPNPTE